MFLVLSFENFNSLFYLDFMIPWPFWSPEGNKAKDFKKLTYFWSKYLNVNTVNLRFLTNCHTFSLITYIIKLLSATFDVTVPIPYQEFMTECVTYLSMMLLEAFKLYFWDSIIKNLSSSLSILSTYVSYRSKALWNLPISRYA